MNKDIIYIDTEDDITAIIGKIKASSEDTVALVPPKRTGVLQSAVNLRLLSRTAEKNKKKLVLITNNKALIALSAPAKIPVAKNLQANPEIAEIAALEIDDGEDIIDGSSLPIGELVKTTDYSKSDDISDDISTIDIDGEGPEYIPESSDGPDSKKPYKKSKKSDIKVPNFPQFRKKLFLGIAGGVLLLIFLVWAIWFAPAATIIITAKTEPAPVSQTLKLGGTTPTDVSKNIIQTVIKQSKKDISVEFTATGTKDMGQKSTGTITIENCDDTNPIVIPAGTAFVTAGKQYLSNSQATIPGLSGSSHNCQIDGTGAGTANVAVTAGQSGESYNINATAYSIAGVSGFVYANGSAMAGGTTRMATVVTAADVQTASQALVDLPTNDSKSQLTKQFTNGEKVITDSFTVDRAAAVSVPAIGAEATTKAKLTSQTTFSLTGIAKSELVEFLDASLKKQTDSNQRVYNNGFDKVVLSGYLKDDQGSFVNIGAVGQIGPKIDDASIKNEVKGKHYGDVQSLIKKEKGVTDVDVKFSYFWVTTVPNDVKKIKVEFVLSDA
ncbi:MAG: hypothetical protein WCK26_03030 [Candidatus Saccharibacteria bacterium]